LQVHLIVVFIKLDISKGGEQEEISTFQS